MIKKGIPYGKQEITQEDIDSVINVLKSDFLTQGPEIDKFEKEFANYVGASYAIAVSNGTAALHLANLAIGTKPGSRVITTPISFAASSNCVLYCGGQVEFVDIDPSTFLLDLNKLEDILKRAPAGTYSGIVSVDFAGLPVDMEAMRTIADNYELFIIQDACHSPGGFFVNSTGGKSYCGSCEYSDMTCFSFHPVKHIATGEGGMVTTNDEKLYDKLLALRTHGIVKDNTKFINKNARASESTSEEYPGWYMEMQYLGYNYRLTDIQSALGLSQLKRVDLNISKRQMIANNYLQSLSNLPLKYQEIQPLQFHAYHLFVILIEKRRELYDFLISKGIFCQVHYIPIYKHPYYHQIEFKKVELPNAENYYNQCLSLPIFPSLKDDEFEYVVNSIKEFYE